MFRVLPIALFVLISQQTSAASPSQQKWTYEMGRGSGSVESFSPTKPKLFVVHGKGESPRGKFLFDAGKVTGSAKFRLDTLDTGIALRNTHLRDKYLETKKYPEAELKLEPLSLPASFAQSSSAAEVPFKGLLSLHGMAKPIVGQANVKRSDSKLTLQAEFVIKLPDYGIETPGFAGVTVSDEVRIVIQSTGELQ